MKFYPRILLAGLMGLPAADCLRHGDVWLCGSFAAGAAFVLAANRLFGETAALETVDETRFGNGGAGRTTATLSGRMRTNCAMAVGRPRRWRLVNIR
jgi:hypothetical protein